MYRSIHVMNMPRDVVLTKNVWERTQKISILKQVQTHFKAKLEKDVRTPFPHVPAPLHPSRCRESHIHRVAVA